MLLINECGNLILSLRNCWAAEKLTEDEARAMLQDLELAAPADEGPLMGLFSRWAARGRQDSPEPQVQIKTVSCVSC